MSVNEHRQQPAEKRFEILAGSSSHSATFVLGNEDHTLGNALRHVLMQRPEVDFCGYSVPHPSEPKMNVRLQTTTRPALDVFQDGLRDLKAICENLELEIESMPHGPVTKKPDADGDVNMGQP